MREVQFRSEGNLTVCKMALPLPFCVLQGSLDTYIICPIFFFFLCNTGSLNIYLLNVVSILDIFGCSYEEKISNSVKFLCME